MGVWFLIVSNTNPYETDTFTHVAFFASLFLFLSGFLTMMIYYLRVWRSNYESVFTPLGVATRDGALLASLVVGMLALQTVRVLSWWTAALLILAALIIEVVANSKKHA